jgi:ketosteroid isomerase-like protein
MSEENVEMVRKHIEAWAAKDAAGAASFFDPHVVLDSSRTIEIDSVAYGPEAVAEHFRRYAGTFENYRWETQRLTDLGSGAVLAVATETGRGKGSGISVDRSVAMVYTVIDGKIVRMTSFRTEHEALEAAGLRE